MGRILTLAVLMGLSCLPKKRDREIGPDLPYHFAFWIFTKTFAIEQYKMGCEFLGRVPSRCAYEQVDC